MILEPIENVRWEGKPKYLPYILSQVLAYLIIGGVILFFIKWSADPNVEATGSGVDLIRSNPFFWGSVFDIVFVLLLVIVLVVAHLRYSVTHYAITNKRAIFQGGIIGRDFKSVDYDKMQNVSVNIGIFGVIFGVGDVRVFSGEFFITGNKRGSATSPIHDVFRYITGPYDVLQLLQKELSYRKESLYGGHAAKNV